MQEGKVYYSEKHKLYGYKVEVSIRPNEISSAFTEHYPGSVSDIEIMHKRLHLHKCRLEKRDEDDGITDDFQMYDKYGNYWDVLMDKGYQGATEVLDAVVPKKKPSRGILSRFDE